MSTALELLAREIEDYFANIRELPVVPEWKAAQVRSRLESVAGFGDPLELESALERLIGSPGHHPLPDAAVFEAELCTEENLDLLWAEFILEVCDPFG